MVDEILNHARIVHAERLNHDQLYRSIFGSLKAAIKDHGPITLDYVEAATKRIAGQIKGAIKSKFLVVEGRCLNCNGTNDQEPFPIKLCSKCCFTVDGYTVIFEQGGAYVPELPGCVAVGETFEEVKTLIIEAVKEHTDVG